MIKIFSISILCIFFLFELVEGKGICEQDPESYNSKKEFIEESVNNFLKEVRKGGESAEDLIPCLELVMQMCDEEGMGVTLVKSYDILGQYHLMLGQFQQARTYVFKGLHVSDSIKNIKCQARMLNSLGNIESESGNVEKAIKYYLNSKKAWEKKNARSKILGLDINIASLYLDQGNYDQANDLFKSCLEVAKDLQKTYLINLCLVNLGILQEKAGNYKESLAFFKEVIIQSNNSIPQPILHKALVYASKLSLRLKEFDKAEYYFNQAVNVNNEREKLDLYISWGDGLSIEGLYKPASEKYLLAKESALQLNDNYQLSIIYKKLSSVYRQMDDYKNGWMFYELYRTINDTLRSEEKRLKLEQIISKYERRERELKISALERQRKSDSIIKIITIALLIALLIAFSIFYSRYRLKKSTSEKLQKKNDKLTFQNNQIKTREKLLKKKNQEIEEKNGLLALHSNKIDQQNRELQRYNLDLEQFAYSVSHDLKAPIRSINSFLFLIQKNLKNYDVASEYLEIAQDNSQLLANLLEDLLTYTRIGRSELAPSLVNLNEILEKVIKNLHYLIKKTNAEIILDELPVVNGYAADLYLLFQNLLQNSIKFKKDDLPPRIEVTSQTTPKYYLISVKDNGVGIKQEYQEKIFKIFKRVNHELEGTGVGLAIVKKIIEYHNGDVSIESEEGKGATFHIKLDKAL